MKFMKNKNGFTLVELLAVIVILALIMGIAAYSMQGVTENVKISSIKSSALSYVDGVRTTLLSTMNLEEGDYYFSQKMLETDVESPWGKYVYYSGDDTTISNSLTSTGVAKANSTNALVCGNSGSFVRIGKLSSGDYTYAACLYDDAGNYVFADEQILTNSKTKSDYYKQATTGSTVTMATDGKIA